MKVKLFLIIGTLVAIFAIANTVPARAQQWQQQQQMQLRPPVLDCSTTGGYWHEGCMNPYQRQQLYRRHGYPEWHRPLIRPYAIGQPVPLGYPNGGYGYGGYGAYGGGQVTVHRREWYRHEHREWAHHVDAGSEANDRNEHEPNRGTCTMVAPHAGEPGFVWSDGRCHHLPTSYEQ